jgi:hypothetical protein
MRSYGLGPDDQLGGKLTVNGVHLRLSLLAGIGCSKGTWVPILTYMYVTVGKAVSNHFIGLHCEDSTGNTPAGQVIFRAHSGCQ